MGFIWALIVGGVIGAIAGAITKKGSSMGIIANIIAGLVGSTIGQAILGTWGPSLAGMAIVPSIIGAVILVAIVSWILGRKYRKFKKIGHKSFRLMPYFSFSMYEEVSYEK